MPRYMIDTVADGAGNVPPLPARVNLPGVGESVISLRMGYVNGRYYWKSVFPDVWVDVLAADPKADVLDCENGDATPQQCPGWARAHNAAGTGFPAIIYCNRANLTPVFNAMTAAGLRIAKDFYTIVATLDGTTRLADMTGVIGVQAWGAAQLGFNADVTVVYDDAWKQAPPQGPYAHLTDGRMSLGQIAASRNMALPQWLDIQAGAFTPGDADAWGKLVPPAGLRWWSVNP